MERSCETVVVLCCCQTATRVHRVLRISAAQNAIKELTAALVPVERGPNCCSPYEAMQQRVLCPIHLENVCDCTSRGAGRCLYVARCASGGNWRVACHPRCKADTSTLQSQEILADHLILCAGACADKQGHQDHRPGSSVRSPSSPHTNTSTHAQPLSSTPQTTACIEGAAALPLANLHARLAFLDPAVRRVLLGEPAAAAAMGGGLREGHSGGGGAAAAGGSGGSGSGGGGRAGCLPAGCCVALYRGLLHPELPGLAFVGWQAAPSTTRPQLLQLQAQWLAAHLAGRLLLPPPEDMRAEMVASFASPHAETTAPHGALPSYALTLEGQLQQHEHAQERYLAQLRGDLVRAGIQPGYLIPPHPQHQQQQRGQAAQQRKQQQEASAAVRRAPRSEDHFLRTSSPYPSPPPPPRSPQPSILLSCFGCVSSSNSSSSPQHARPSGAPMRRRLLLPPNLTRTGQNGTAYATCLRGGSIHVPVPAGPTAAAADAQSRWGKLFGRRSMGASSSTISGATRAVSTPEGSNHSYVSPPPTTQPFTSAVAPASPSPLPVSTPPAPLMAMGPTAMPQAPLLQLLSSSSASVCNPEGAARPVSIPRDSVECGSIQHASGAAVQGSHQPQGWPPCPGGDLPCSIPTHPVCCPASWELLAQQPHASCSKQTAIEHNMPAGAATAAAEVGTHPDGCPCPPGSRQTLVPEQYATDGPAGQASPHYTPGTSNLPYNPRHRTTGHSVRRPCRTYGMEGRSALSVPMPVLPKAHSLRAEEGLEGVDAQAIAGRMERCGGYQRDMSRMLHGTSGTCSVGNRHRRTAPDAPPETYDSMYLLDESACEPYNLPYGGYKPFDAGSREVRQHHRTSPAPGSESASSASASHAPPLHQSQPAPPATPQPTPSHLHSAVTTTQEQPELPSTSHRLSGIGGAGGPAASQPPPYRNATHTPAPVSPQLPLWLRLREAVSRGRRREPETAAAISNAGVGAGDSSNIPGAAVELGTGAFAAAGMSLGAPAAAPNSPATAFPAAPRDGVAPAPIKPCTQQLACAAADSGRATGPCGPMRSQQQQQQHTAGQQQGRSWSAPMLSLQPPTPLLDCATAEPFQRQSAASSIMHEPVMLLSLEDDDIQEQLQEGACLKAEGGDAAAGEAHTTAAAAGPAAAADKGGGCVGVDVTTWPETGGEAVGAAAAAAAGRSGVKVGNLHSSSSKNSSHGSSSSSSGGGGGNSTGAEALAFGTCGVPCDVPIPVQLADPRVEAPGSSMLLLQLLLGTVSTQSARCHRGNLCTAPVGLLLASCTREEERQAGTPLAGRGAGVEEDTDPTHSTSAGAFHMRPYALRAAAWRRSALQGFIQSILPFEAAESTDGSAVHVTAVAVGGYKVELEWFGWGSDGHELVEVELRDASCDDRGGSGGVTGGQEEWQQQQQEEEEEKEQQQQQQQEEEEEKEQKGWSCAGGLQGEQGRGVAGVWDSFRLPLEHSGGAASSSCASGLLQQHSQPQGDCCDEDISPFRGSAAAAAAAAAAADAAHPRMRPYAWRAAHGRTSGVKGSGSMLFRALARNGQVQNWDQQASLMDVSGTHEPAPASVAAGTSSAASLSCGGAAAGVQQQQLGSGAGAACKQEGITEALSLASGLREYGVLHRQLQGGWDGGLLPAQGRPLAVSGCFVPMCRTWQRLAPNGSNDPWVISSTCRFRPFAATVVDVGACAATEGAWDEGGFGGGASLVAESLSPFVFSGGVSTSASELGSRVLEPTCAIAGTFSLQLRRCTVPAQPLRGLSGAQSAGCGART